MIAEDRDAGLRKPLVLHPDLGRRAIRHCAVCDKGLMHNGLPLAWRVTIERFGFDRRAVEHEIGLELMVGSPAVATALSPNRALASRIDGPTSLLICETCFMGSYTLPMAWDHACSEREDAGPASAGGR